jgi:hypothetical protein
MRIVVNAQSAKRVVRRVVDPGTGGDLCGGLEVLYRVVPVPQVAKYNVSNSDVKKMFFGQKSRGQIEIYCAAERVN